MYYMRWSIYNTSFEMTRCEFSKFIEVTKEISNVTYCNWYYCHCTVILYYWICDWVIVVDEKISPNVCMLGMNLFRKTAVKQH